jgi:hypothetical protein
MRPLMRIDRGDGRASSAPKRRTALIPRARLVHTEDMMAAFNMFAALRQAGCFAADGIAPRQG